MAEMKDSGIEWIGDIPQNWKLKRIQFCLDEINEKNIPIKTEQVLSLVKDKGVMLYEDKGNQGNKAKEDVSQYKVAYPNTLIVNSMNILIGSVGISNYLGCVSPVYYVFKENEDSDLRYINYIFNTREFQKELRKYANGILEIRLRVSSSDIFKRKIPFPDKHIQTKIANFLDKKCAEIDALHTDIEKQIETLEEYKKSIITEAVTKGLINININGTQVDFTNTTDEQWECKKLKLLVAMPIIDGPHESPELCDTGIPYISATAIVDGKIDFNLMRGYISEEYCTECEKRYKPQLNDILVVKLGAGTGQVAMVDDNRKFNIWVPLAAVRCNELVIPKFIYYGFQSDYVVTQMEQSWTYGTQETLGVKTIEKLKFFIPTLNTQRKIIQYLDNKCVNIDGAIEEKKEQLDTLEQYKKSLIYEYVTGKKEVK